MNLQNLKFNFFAIYCCQITVTSRFYPIFEFPMLIYQALDAGCRNRKWMKMIRKNNLLKKVGTEVFISEGVASVPAVYQFLSVEQKSKVIFVPRFF